MPTLHVIDVDDTLFNTDAKIRVLDKDDVEVERLTPREFKSYELKQGEKYDWSEYTDGAMFFRTSRPIQRMVDRVRELMKDHEDRRKDFTIFLTARGDQTDKELFLQAFRRAGIDVDRGHVERAGNYHHIEKDGPRRKAYIVDRRLRQGEFDRVMMYDDDEANLIAVLRLDKVFPQVNFQAFLVDETGHVTPFDERNPWEESTASNSHSTSARSTSSSATGPSSRKDTTRSSTTKWRRN